MRCSYCGINNPPNNTTCFNCHKPLGISIHVEDELPDLPTTQKFRLFRNLASRFRLTKDSLQSKKESFITNYGVFSRSWLAGWLGLIPGLGQLYNGQLLKSLLFFTTFSLFVFGIYHWLYSYYSNYLLYLTFILIAYSFMDAFLTNLLRNRQQKTTLRQKISLVFYGLFMFGSTISLGQWLLYPFFAFVYMNNNNLFPVIHHSDRILINKIPYWKHEPERGDLVWYILPGFEAIDYAGVDITGSPIENRYWYTKGNNMEKIIALPGETILFKDNKIYINDKELAKEYYPMIDDKKPGDLTYTLPRDSYFIVLSRVPQWGDTISDSIVQHGVFKLFPGSDAEAVLQPHKAIIRDNKNWLKACVIKRSGIEGKAWIVYDPPPRRKVFH